MTPSSRPRIETEKLISAFLEESGLQGKGFEICPIPGDGSRRVFWRIIPDVPSPSYILMENPPADVFSRRENLAYAMIGRHLYEKALPLPKIHRFDQPKGIFIMEDMGETTLQESLKGETDRIQVYKPVVEVLLRLQVEGAEGFDTGWTCQTERYDRVVMRSLEAEYFRDSFLSRYAGLKGEWEDLEVPFDHLAKMASTSEGRFFLHRDFQSRNIMIHERKIGILDWQGGRLGPLAYDLASLLIDPYTDLTVPERQRAYRHYLDCLRDRDPGQVNAFQESYPYLAIQRNLQILGAFSFLTMERGKSYFAAYIPVALKTLRGLLSELGDPKLSPLADLLGSLPW